jgi:hypothetical protein
LAKPTKCSTLIHFSAGFGERRASLMIPPLFKKKLQSQSEFQALLSSRCMTQIPIRNENIFLSFSNNPQHTLVYASFTASRIVFANRCSTESALEVLSMHTLKR